MIGKDFSSSIRVGYSQFPTEFHCHLCNVSFTKRKFLRMHCDGLFHRDKVILSQASTTGHQLLTNQNSELLFMPAQPNSSSYNRIMYFESDERSDEKSTAFRHDRNLVNRNDVQERTNIQEESSSIVSTNSKGCSLSISPETCSGSESFHGHEVQRNMIPGFLFDHLNSSDFLSTQTGKQSSHDEEFHEDVRLSFTETVPQPCRAESASNVMNEFDCKLCQRFTPAGGSHNEHLSSLEHCKLLLLRQHELGLAKFHRMYGDVPFLRILSASVPVPPPEFDANLTRIYRSAVVNELRCRACGTKHEDLKSWFGHSLGESHSEILYDLLHQSDVYMFLSMFGDLPLPESMLPLLDESGRAKESNYLQMPRERSSLNQLKKNLKPLGNLKVIDHNFAAVDTPLRKRSHSTVDSSTECGELADDSKPKTVSAAGKNNMFRNIVKVVDHNFESVPEVNGPQEQNLPSYSPTRLLESLNENLWLLKVASLSSHSASELQASNTKHASHKSELPLSSEGKGSKPDQKTERLHVESSGAKDIPVVSEDECLEQLNQIVEHFFHLSGSHTQSDEAISVSQCATTESDCQKGFGEISRILVLISNPTQRITSHNEKFMMSEEEADYLTSVNDAAAFEVDLAGVDDANGRIPVLASSFRMAPEPRSVGGCTFKHLRSVAPQSYFSQLEVTSNCEKIGVVVSCSANGQSEDQITRSFNKVTEAAFDLDQWSSSCGSLAFSATSSSDLQPASQTTTGDLLPLVDTASHPNYADSRSTMSVSEPCGAIPVITSSKETFPSDVTNNTQQSFPSNDVSASGVKEISNRNAECSASASTARVVSHNSILVASQSPVDREGGLLGISIPSHVTAASTINCCQSNSIHGLEMAKTDHEPVCFATAECTSAVIPALTLMRSACYSQDACSRTEDTFGTVTVSVCASVCSSILPYTPKFPSSACTLTMPTDLAGSMHSAAPHRLVAGSVDVSCCKDAASSASTIVGDLSVIASATDAVNAKLLELPMTTTRTAESDAHVTSQRKVICPSNSSVHVTVPTSNGQSVKSSESASNSLHLSSNSLHPIHNATSSTMASKQDSSMGRNADTSISLACTLNHSISNASLLTDSATFRHPSATMFRSIGPAADILKLSTSAPATTSCSSAGDVTLESMTYLGYSAATMPSKSSAFIDALSDVSPMAKTQTTTYVSEGIRIKLEPTSDADATIDKVIPTLECLPSVTSNKSEGIFFSKSTITTNVLSLSAAISTAKTDISECTKCLFSTATKDNFIERTSFTCSEKTVAVQNSISHHASLVTVTTPKKSLESKHSMAATDMKTDSSTSLVIANAISSHVASTTSHAKCTLQFATTIAKDDSINSFHSLSKTETKVPALDSYMMKNECLVKNSLLRPATDVVASTLQSIPHVIKTIVKCEKNQPELKSISLPSAAAVKMADDVKHAVISTSIADAQLNSISVKHEPSVTADVVEGTSQSAALSTVVNITASASSVADGCRTQSQHGVPASVVKSISQTTSCLATTVVQSTGAVSSRTGTVRLVKRKLLRCSPSIAAIKDISTKCSTSLLVTGVKNTVLNTSTKVKHTLSVMKDSAAGLTTTKSIPSVAETKTNNTASEMSSKSELAIVSKTRVNSVPVTAIKCTSVTSTTVLSKPVITPGKRPINSSKTSTASKPAPLLAIAMVTAATARITSATKAGDAVPLMSIKTSLSNSNPRVGSVTATQKKSQPLISTAAVTKVAIVSTSESTTNVAALKSSKVVASKTSVTSVVNCCSVAVVTSKISTVSAQGRRSISSSKTFTTSNPAPLLAITKVTEATARITSRTTCSLTTSKPTSSSTSSGSATRAATSAPTSSITVTHHNTTAADSGSLVGPMIRVEVVIKTEPEDNIIGAPILLGDDSTASSNSQTKESPVSAAEPANVKKPDNPAISESPPIISQSSANPKQSLLGTPDRKPSCSFASTSPKKRECRSTFIPRNQQRFNSQISHRQARWRTELEATGNRFVAPLFGEDVDERRNWSDSMKQKYSNSFYRQNCSPPPKIRRLMPRDDICNTDNFNNQHFWSIQERKLEQFADRLKDVAIVLQRNSRRFSFSENVIFAKSLPWLERQKLDLLSEFTGVQDSRVLLSASQLLACLDLSLLQQVTDLQMLCLESSVDIRDMMMHLLEALVEGCHHNLF